jgi:chaperonin GroEL
MRKNFALLKNLEENFQAINDIDDAVKITLGPTGKNGIVTVFDTTKKFDLKVITSGSALIKALSFDSASANVILELVRQAAVKTFTISGDGSTTTILFSCQLLKTSLRFLTNGYNCVFLSNGLKKLSYFLMDKIVELSLPISQKKEIIGVLRTALGRKVNPELFELLTKSVDHISRDGLILVEENISMNNEIEVVQGIELDRGFASSYFVNDVKNFEVTYENPYVLITNQPINSINQIKDIIEFVKENNRALVIVAEEINKNIISTLVLNNIQKKLKVVVVRYSAIKFMKTGILEDLATLTHAKYSLSALKENYYPLTVNDLGQAEKIIVKKDKSTFIISKFSKLIAKRRINELNRELLTSETEYEKSLFKTRIARLSGQIAKIKIGLSNQYEAEEQRQKVENAMNTIKSSLEEGILPGGGYSYLTLRNFVANWSSVNLVGDEFFASQIIMEALARPNKELFVNANTNRFKISQELIKLGHPFGYDLSNQKIVNTLKTGLVDSTKTVRGIIWNSISVVSTIITSE